MNSVPFVDLLAQHDEVRGEIEAAVKDILDHSSFIGGSYVSSFEREFASYIGVKEAVAVANGTDALWLGLVAAGIGPGAAVITVSNTFIATVEAITRSGAAPLFVDIDLKTATIDVNAVRTLLETECVLEDDGRVIHLKTGYHVAAILPVHLYGLPADMEAVIELARAYRLKVLEDACQAHGAMVRLNGVWKKAGSLGYAAGFSFYPGKNLGAIGDAGALTTDDQELAARIRWLRDHGSSEKYIHVTPDGWNSRLDAVQAAVLSIKLKRLDDWNSCRRRAAEGYRQSLSHLPLELPVEPEYSKHIYHLYVVRTVEREKLRKGLSERGVGVGLHYPIPLHLQKAYEHLGFKPGSFPYTERSASTGLSLPMHPALRPEQIDQVARACSEILC